MNEDKNIPKFIAPPFPKLEYGFWHYFSLIMSEIRVWGVAGGFAFLMTFLWISNTWIFGACLTIMVINVWSMDRVKRNADIKNQEAMRLEVKKIMESLGNTLNSKRDVDKEGK